MDAEKLREEGSVELAEMVDDVVQQVEHALGGEIDVEEVEHALADAKAAAAKLRKEGKEEEAAQSGVTFNCTFSRIIIP